MADKLDFMTELARDVEAKKRGQTGTLGTISDFVPKHKNLSDSTYEDGNDFDIPVPSASSQNTRRIEAAPQYEEPQQYEAQEPQYESVPAQEEAPQPESNRPASFHEEERVKVDKPKFQIGKGLIAIIVAAFALIGFLIWFFGMRAKIIMPDFTGKPLTEVTNWASQNKIEASSLARTYDFSLEYDSDVVISQSPDAGTKIKTDTPITLVVSKGANPDDPVDFPDIKSMTYSELTDWKNENKLTKTKISTEYNTAFEKDAVISYELKNVSESEFTRGSTLTIKVSKGPAPAGQVTVENFVGKNFTEANTWATNKKVRAVKQEVNSDTVDSGMIISQTPSSGTAIAEGDTITFVVSKGKGVKIPNLVGYSKEQLEAWSSSKNNTVTIVKKSVYNDAPLGSVIGQSPAAGTILDSGDVLMLTISLYMPILETNSRAWLGKDYLELRAWCDDVNYNGADIQAGSWGEWATPACSDTYPTPGQVIEYACYYGTSDLADGCGRPLNNYSRINYRVSSGACTVEKPKQVVIATSNIASLEAINSFCQSNKMTCDFTPNSNLEKNVRVKFWNESGSEVCRETEQQFADIIMEESTIYVQYKPVNTTSSSTQNGSSDTTNVNAQNGAQTPEVSPNPSGVSPDPVVPAAAAGSSDAGGSGTPAGEGN